MVTTWSFVCARVYSRAADCSSVRENACMFFTMRNEQSWMVIWRPQGYYGDANRTDHQYGFCAVCESNWRTDRQLGTAAWPWVKMSWITLQGCRQGIKKMWTISAMKRPNTHTEWIRMVANPKDLRCCSFLVDASLDLLLQRVLFLFTYFASYIADHGPILFCLLVRIGSLMHSDVKLSRLAKFVASTLSFFSMHVFLFFWRALLTKQASWKSSTKDKDSQATLRINKALL